MRALQRFEKLNSLIKAYQLPVEGIILLDEDNVIGEYHYADDKPRNIYSHTKSYLSLAIGIARDFGLISLDDRLVDSFSTSGTVYDSKIDDIRLADLLKMASGFGKPYLMSANRRSGTQSVDYVSYMLEKDIIDTPGTRFVYSSADSILAMKMLEKAVNEPVGVFIYKHIFSKLSQGWPIWEHDMYGTPVGCGGMQMTLRDMSKLGQVYLKRGKYHDTVIVSEDWIKLSSSKQIETKDKEDVWHCGYGYQFWMCPYENAFRADGKYGQLTVVFPDSGFVFGIQCPENGNFAVVKKFLHEEFFTQI